jgi:4'-phosphopantetheinyl transferase
VDQVELWLIRTDAAGPPPGGLLALLDPHEQSRASALLLEHDRHRFITAHAAVRLIVGRHLGVPPIAVRWRRGSHGKPFLAGPGPQVSLSHSGAFALLGLTAQRPLGVDIQRIGEQADVPRLTRRFYPPGEAGAVLAAATPDECARRFTRLWTRKEACVKAAGGRLVPGLALIAGPAASDLPGTGLVVTGTGSLPGPFLVQDTTAPPGFCASVALAGPRPFRLVSRAFRLPREFRAPAGSAGPPDRPA